mgnify:CR=1 FL=1
MTHTVEGISVIYPALEEAIRASLYESILDILGTTGTIFPMGDDKHGLLSASTFKTVGSEQITVTPSEVLSDFDEARTFKGVVPVLRFNGTDEEADSPDADYWSAGADGTTGNEPIVSMGAWVNQDTQVSADFIFSKYDSAGNTREYEFYLSSGKPLLAFYDESVAANPVIYTMADAAISSGAYHLVVGTYDGRNGTQHPSDIDLYVDGAVVASTDTDDGAYVAMENLGGTLKLAHSQATPTFFFDGFMAGGPLGPFFTQKKLSADEVLRLYEIGRRALDL